MPDSTNRRIGSRNGRDAESFKKGIADHLKYTLGLDPQNATIHDKYLAVAYAVRDRLIEGWIETQQEHREKKVKRVYYLSLEFLIGRLLRNSIVNLGSVQSMAKALQELDLNFRLLEEQEPDAGLGNGGLGRLAACFMESLASDRSFRTDTRSRSRMSGLPREIRGRSPGRTPRPWFNSAAG